MGDQGPEDTATKKGKGQHGERARSTWADKDPTPWKSHKGSARAAPPNQTRKQPIRSQKVLDLDLDLSLKEEILGVCFIARGREFQYLGAILLIDLGSERLTKKLLLAPLVA